MPNRQTRRLQRSPMIMASQSWGASRSAIVNCLANRHPRHFAVHPEDCLERTPGRSAPGTAWSAFQFYGLGWRLIGWRAPAGSGGRLGGFAGGDSPRARKLRVVVPVRLSISAYSRFVRYSPVAGVRLRGFRSGCSRQGAERSVHHDAVISPRFSHRRDKSWGRPARAN